MYKKVHLIDRQLTSNEMVAFNGLVISCVKIAFLNFKRTVTEPQALPF